MQACNIRPWQGEMQIAYFRSQRELSKSPLDVILISFYEYTYTMLEAKVPWETLHMTSLYVLHKLNMSKGISHVKFKDIF